MSSTGAMSLPRGDTAYRGGRGRGVYGGGGNPAGTTRINTIEYVTIATLGNGSNFGDLSIGEMVSAVASDPLVEYFVLVKVQLLVLQKLIQ